MTNGIMKSLEVCWKICSLFKDLIERWLRTEQRGSVDYWYHKCGAIGTWIDSGRTAIGVAFIIICTHQSDTCVCMIQICFSLSKCMQLDCQLLELPSLSSAHPKALSVQKMARSRKPTHTHNTHTHTHTHPYTHALASTRAPIHTFSAHNTST